MVVHNMFLNIFFEEIKFLDTVSSYKAVLGQHVELKMIFNHRRLKNKGYRLVLFVKKEVNMKVDTCHKPARKPKLPCLNNKAI